MAKMAEPATLLSKAAEFGVPGELPVLPKLPPPASAIADLSTVIDACERAAAACETYRRVLGLPIEAPQRKTGSSALRYSALLAHVATLRRRTVDALLLSAVAKGADLDVGQPNSPRWQEFVARTGDRGFDLARRAGTRTVDGGLAYVSRYVNEVISGRVPQGVAPGPPLSNLPEISIGDWPRCACGCEDAEGPHRTFVIDLAGFQSSAQLAHRLGSLLRAKMVAAGALAAFAFFAFALNRTPAYRTADTLAVWALLLLVPLQISSYLVWLEWSGRVADNAQVLGLRAPRRLAVVGWWFVPFANLVMVYRSFSQLQSVLGGFGEERTGRGLLRTWWVFVLLASFFSPLNARVDLYYAISNLETALFGQLIAALLVFAASWAGMWIVEDIERRQNARLHNAIRFGINHRVAAR